MKTGRGLSSRRMVYAGTLPPPHMPSWRHTRGVDRGRMSPPSSPPRPASASPCVRTSCILSSSVKPPQQNKMTASMRDGEALASMPLILSKLAWKNSQVRS